MSEISKLIAEIKSEGILCAGNKLEQLYSLATDMEYDYAELQQKLDAMAAENDLARKAVQTFCDVVGANTDAICEEVGAEGVKAILAAMSATGNMPATDAYLNSVRADAVEGFTSDVVLKMRESGAGAYDYADIVEAQGQELVLILRSGTHDTADKAG